MAGPQGPGPYFASSLPQNFALQPDLFRAGFPGSIGGYRIMPPAPSGVAANNSATKSVVVEQIISAQSSADTAQSTADAKSTVRVNGNLLAGEEANFNGSTPAAPGGDPAVIFQADTGNPITNVSGYLPTFGPSGGGHAPGAVPDPGGSSGTTKFLREDGTWNIPPGTGGAANYQTVQKNAVSVTQRPTLNFLDPFVVTDDAGNTSSDISIQTIKLFVNRNLGGNVSVLANTPTTVDSFSMTMPASGGPWRVHFDWFYYIAVAASPHVLIYISDGTNIFANSANKTGQTPWGLKGSGYSTVTYANGATVTFTLIVISQNNITVDAADPVFSTGLTSFCQAVAMASA